MPSKAAFDPEEPSLGRIRSDFIAPPHSPTLIKRFISRVEKNPELANADLFAGDIPLREGHISFLRTDCPGLSPNEPMAIVQVKLPSIPDGRYVIKNRAASILWTTDKNFTGMKTVYFWSSISTIKDLKNFKYNWCKVN